MDKRAAIYVRVSTDKQTIENQLRELRQIAKRRGWEVVHEYHDAGISGSKGREARPGLDEMLNDPEAAVRCRHGLGDRPTRTLAHRPPGHDPGAGGVQG